MNSKARFTPQHTSKCYCKCGYSYPTSAKLPDKSGKEFVKIRSEFGQLKPRAERIFDSLPPSRSQSKCSAHSLTGFSAQSSNSFLSQSSSKSSSDLQLTDRRLRYESIKDDLHGPETTSDDTRRVEQSYEALNSRNNDDLEELSDFRLSYSKDCFGPSSQASIRRRLKKPQHVCEFRYHVNERGLLEPSHKNHAGRTICPQCKNVLDTKTKPGTVPVLSQSSKHQFILEVQEKDLENAKMKKVRLKPLPTNSLALSQQPTIW